MLCNFIENTEVDFATINSMGGIDDPIIQLICKYNRYTYENAFQVLDRLVSEKHPS